MGRSPGALNGDRMRRRYLQDWELRDPRFEEIDSEDDGYGQGVILEPNSYAARDARARGSFVSDELYFDGYDLGRNRISRHSMYDQAPFGDDFDSDELEYREQRGLAFQQAVRDKEEALIQSALERIARARAKGKTNVNLTQEEMEALERRRGQQPEQLPPLASPPVTPAKSAKGVKTSSRSNSSTNLASKTRKRGGSGLFGTSPSPAKSNSKAKVNRKPSAERALPYPMGQAPHGVMVNGADGAPVHAPIGSYGPPSPDFRRSHSRTRASQPSSRSGSRHSRRESTPPERTAEYTQYPLRYYHPGTSRPDSSGSNRSLPDDIDWYPPPPTGRHRSSSNLPYGGYAADYEGALLPAAQGRRNVSGPPDVRYASLRRVPPSSSPLAQRPVPAHASHSEPTVGVVKRTSGLSQELGSSSDSSPSSSSSDDQGVQVEIVPDPTGVNGYSISRAPASAALPSGNEGRRRKGGRR